MASSRKKNLAPAISEEQQQKLREQHLAEQLTAMLDECYIELQGTVLKQMLKCSPSDLVGLQAKLIACQAFKDSLLHRINEGKRVASKVNKEA